MNVFQACPKDKIRDTLRLMDRQHPGIYTGSGVKAEFIEEDAATRTHAVVEVIDLASLGFVPATPKDPVPS